MGKVAAPSIYANELEPGDNEHQPEGFQHALLSEFADAEGCSNRSAEQDSHGEERQVRRKSFHGGNVAKKACHRIAEDEHRRNARDRARLRLCKEEQERPQEDAATRSRQSREQANDRPG